MPLILIGPKLNADSSELKACAQRTWGCSLAGVRLAGDALISVADFDGANALKGWKAEGASLTLGEGHTGQGAALAYKLATGGSAMTGWPAGLPVAVLLERQSHEKACHASVPHIGATVSRPHPCGTASEFAGRRSRHAALWRSGRIFVGGATQPPTRNRHAVPAGLRSIDDVPKRLCK